MEKDIKEFIKDRNEAILSLDKEKIKAYQRKYNIPTRDEDEDIFWIAVHKSVTVIQSAPDILRQQSIRWLTERGFSHY